MNRPTSVSILVYQRLAVSIVLKVVNSKNLPEPVKMAFRMSDLATKTSNSGKLGLSLMPFEKLVNKTYLGKIM